MSEWHKIILEKSISVAESRSHDQVTPEHLLFCLLDDADAHRSMCEVVSNRDWDIPALYIMLVKHIDNDMNLLIKPRDSTHPPEISSTVEELLYYGEKHSLDYASENWMSTDRKVLPPAVGVLLEILHRDDTYAAKCLKAVGINEDDLMSYIELGPKVLINPKVKPPKPPKPPTFL
jgi:hypothetical protein